MARDGCSWQPAGGGARLPQRTKENRREEQRCLDAAVLNRHKNDEGLLLPVWLQVRLARIVRRWNRLTVGRALRIIDTTLHYFLDVTDMSQLHRLPGVYCPVGGHLLTSFSLRVSHLLPRPRARPTFLQGPRPRSLELDRLDAQCPIG